MKKSLIALAALAATASFAQSTATIYGVVDLGVQSNDYKGNKVSGINNNGSATSQIHFAVNEDLGGGLKAIFDSETDFNPVQSQGNTGWASSIANATNSGAGSWMNSETKVGLSGSFGELVGGVVNDQALYAHLTGQFLGTAIGSGYGSVLKASAGTSASSGSVVRFDNSVRYVSPSFGGFKLGYLWAGKQTKSNNSQPFSTTLGAYDRAGVSEITAMYNNGPLNAMLTQQTVNNADVTVPGAASYATLTSTNGPTAAAGTAGTVTAKLTSLAANYNFGDLTVGFINQTLKDNLATAGVNTSANVLGAKYVMGVNTFSLTAGSLNNKVLAKNSTFTGLGYDYALSKTTALYARYESLKDDGVTVAAVSGFTESNTTRTRTAVGVRVGF